MLVHEVADVIQLDRGNGASIDRARNLPQNVAQCLGGQLLLGGTGDRKVDDTGCAKPPIDSQPLVNAYLDGIDHPVAAPGPEYQ